MRRLAAWLVDALEWTMAAVVAVGGVALLMFAIGLAAGAYRWPL